MKPTVYLETSVVSYLRMRPSNQVISAARQLLTRRWWDTERQNYELVTSEYVLNEAAQGEPALAAERLRALAPLPILAVSIEIPTIASELLSAAALPRNAELDALHIAIAAFHSVDYLLTWNCKHIANARIIRRIRKVLLDLNLATPIICTPEELVYETD